MANHPGMYDFEMKPTISFKFLDGSDELIYNLRTWLAAVSHLEWNKGPVSRFVKASGQCPKLFNDTKRGCPGRSKNCPLTAKKAGLRRLASFEGEEVLRSLRSYARYGGPIILANRSPFPCALRKGK
ncbi:hypothetical protein AVEN_13310-1 [Araneus ventricosus]|uniref:Uncharacterized protein n=1 Tax=Araneus ventricosus TaxID=182803 RepID=A0A4Y2IIF4_ARAVE|nr:hypothetical protein AVEN_13310-1 [Araneus ventricosus]